MDLNILLRGLWDRIGGWALIALGLVFIIAGWFGVSDKVLPSEQIPYVVSGGIGGLALIGIGGTLVISAGIRDQWIQLADLENRLPSSDAEPAPGHTILPAEQPKGRKPRRSAPTPAATS